MRVRFHYNGMRVTCALFFSRSKTRKLVYVDALYAELDGCPYLYHPN